MSQYSQGHLYDLSDHLASRLRAKEQRNGGAFLDRDRDIGQCVDIVSAYKGKGSETVAKRNLSTVYREAQQICEEVSHIRRMTPEGFAAQLEKRLETPGEHARVTLISGAVRPESIKDVTGPALIYAVQDKTSKYLPCAIMPVEGAATDEALDGALQAKDAEFRARFAGLKVEVYGTQAKKPAHRRPIRAPSYDTRMLQLPPGDRD